MEILAIGIFGIMAISISELWQSNKTAHWSANNE